MYSNTGCKYSYGESRKHRFRNFVMCGEEEEEGEEGMKRKKFHFAYTFNIVEFSIHERK